MYVFDWLVVRGCLCVFAIVSDDVFVCMWLCVCVHDCICSVCVLVNFGPCVYVCGCLALLIGVYMRVFVCVCVCAFV